MKHEKVSPAEYGQKMKDIVSGILELQDLGVIQNWFSGLGRGIAFGRAYSPSNILMVHHQVPNATWTDGPNCWNRLGCYWNAQTAIFIFAPAGFGVQCPDCKKATAIAKGLTICRICGKEIPTEKKPVPLGFRLIPVFDFADVEVGPKGEKNPKIIALRELQKKRLPKLEKFTTEEGAKLSKTAAALIRHIEGQGVAVKTKVLNRGAAYCSPGLLVYDEALSMGENLGAITHEWGHLCHHFGNDRYQLTKETEELEAEMFSALVLGAFGADIKAKAAYLLNWSKGADKQTREVLFIKAFHRIYHQAVDTIKAVNVAMDPKLSEILDRIQATENEAESASAPTKTVATEGKAATIEIKRPGKLGTVMADLESATKTLVADASKFPGEPVTIQIILPEGAGKLSGAMLLDPALLSGRYLKNMGACAVPGIIPLFLPLLPKMQEAQKHFVAEITIQVNEFTRVVDSYAAANKVLDSLTERVQKTIGPKVKCRVLFEDETLHECHIRLIRGRTGRLEDRIRKGCEFLTGTKLEIVSEELYREAIKSHRAEEIATARWILEKCSLEDPPKEGEAFTGIGIQIGLFNTLFGPNYTLQPQSGKEVDTDGEVLSEKDYEDALHLLSPTRKTKPPIPMPAFSIGSIDDHVFGVDAIEEASSFLAIPDEMMGIGNWEEQVSIEIYDTNGAPQELCF